MKLSPCLSFYLRHSPRGYMVGTTMRLPGEIVEASAPKSHHRISRKFPQYHMRTYSASCREDVCSADRSTKGSGATIGALYPEYYGSPVIAQKIWTQLVPSSSKWLANHTPRTGHDPTSLG
jgi:hypothetical protein